MKPPPLVAPWLGGILVALVAAPAFAQVPQDTTFTGRLVDDFGNPLIGPVDLELRIFDAETLGTQLYSERHLGTALNATGGFSVQLGLGTSPSGSFDAALFSDVDRWLEVVVGTEVLTPRQIVGSVPWALIAQQANEVVPDPSAPRFEDCGDGTLADHQTGLQWEKKSGTPDTSIRILCRLVACPDPHGVNNEYSWSMNLTDPDGVAFTDFLARLNATFEPSNPKGCFADRCDWRLPEISELQTILIGPDAAPGQGTSCPVAGPCIDPAFAALGGSTRNGTYWSASTHASSPLFAWTAAFLDGDVAAGNKASDFFVRAVRTGSCR